MFKTFRECEYLRRRYFNPKANRDRRSLFESKTSREIGVPKAEEVSISRRYEYIRRVSKSNVLLNPVYE